MGLDQCVVCSERCPQDASHGIAESREEDEMIIYRSSVEESLDALPTELVVRVLVYRCKTCDFLWTDHEAEAARTDAILRHVQKRATALEQLLVRARHVLCPSPSSSATRATVEGVVQDIEAMFPPRDQRRHITVWNGETRCGLRIYNAFPAPLLTKRDDEVDCLGCIEQCFNERRGERIQADGLMRAAYEKYSVLWAKTHGDVPPPFDEEGRPR